MEVPLLVVWLFTVLGCQSTLVDAGEVDGARYLYGTVGARGNGLARVTIEVEEGEDALLVSSRPVEPPFEVFVRRLTDPNGVNVLLASDLTGIQFSKTNAVFVDAVSTLNWPVSDADAALVPGTYELEIGVVDDTLNFASQAVDIDVLLKSDEDFATGALAVSVVYTDGLEEDDSVVDAVDDALAQWQALYAQAGIDVQFDVVVVDESGLLPPAFGLEERYVEFSEATPARTVTLVLSETIAIDDLEVLGIAGDIPAPLIPTTRSAVQISLAMAAGPDGSFDDLDTRILAETMAHETAHYLGLFHPVEREAWRQWDILEDTSQCRNESACVERLGGNLMFPYPVCNLRTCTPQNELSANQVSVLNRAVAVR